MRLTKHQQVAYEDLKRYGDHEISTQINKRTADSLIKLELAEHVLGGWWGDNKGYPTIRACQCGQCDQFRVLTDKTNGLCEECAHQRREYANSLQ